MKMNKILAAGVAATMAVTSLAAVVSAADEVTNPYVFNMESTKGSFTYEPDVTNGTKSVQVGEGFKYDKNLTVNQNKFALNLLTENDNFGGADVNYDNKKDYNDFDGFIPVKVSFNTANITDENGVVWNAQEYLLTKFGSLTVTVKGRVEDNGSLVQKDYKTQLFRIGKVENNATGATLDANYVFPIYKTDSPMDAFLPERLVAIDSISLDTSTLGNIEISGLGEEAFKEIYNRTEKWQSPFLQVNTTYGEGASLANGGANVTYINAAWEEIQTASGIYVVNDNWAFANDLILTIQLADAASLYWDVVADAGNKTQIQEIKSDGTVGGVWRSILKGAPITAAAEGASRGAQLLTEIRKLFDGNVTVKWKTGNGKWTTTKTPAWLPKTETTGDNILSRHEIWELSTTRAYNSTTYSGYDYNQTYDGKRTGDKNTLNRIGNGPEGFAGLASQVADFFNKKTNGKISFHFKQNVTATGSLDWVNGGVPSTEVGLRKLLDAATPDDFVLFVNYGSTTGSLQSTTDIDTDNLLVTFDITTILERLGYQTIGTIQDLYYGCNKGYSTVNGQLGMWVDQVILSYDDSAAAADAADTDEEEEEEIESYDADDYDD